MSAAGGAALCPRQVFRQNSLKATSDSCPLLPLSIPVSAFMHQGGSPTQHTYLSPQLQLPTCPRAPHTPAHISPASKMEMSLAPCKLVS